MDREWSSSRGSDQKGWDGSRFTFQVARKCALSAEERDSSRFSFRAEKRPASVNSNGCVGIRRLSPCIVAGRSPHQIRSREAFRVNARCVKSEPFQ